MNQSAKRILSFVLCLTMLVGMFPAFVFGASAAGTLIDAAIFCSDVHGNPSTVTSVFNGIKSADSTFNPTTASFVGDTQTTASSVTSAAQEVYSGMQCIYAFGNHDDEGDYGIDDFTGLSYGTSDTNYYIYTISENDMSTSSPDTSGFTSTVAGLDKTKPLFIISHMPLHARRDDNVGAAAWYTAISAAAESMDIFFFWAHNHTGDNEVDQAAYYVAKNGSETISVEGGETVTPNFTYANAGYIDPPNTPARNNVATAVRIYDDSVNLTVYNASGVLTGSYAVNETVTREFANGSTDSGDSDGSTDTTTPSEGEDEDTTTTEEKEVYVLVDTMTVGKDYLIANGNTGTVTLLGQSSGSATTTTATVVTSDGYTYIETADSGYVWNATAHTNSSYSSYPRLINAETYAMYPNSGSLDFSSSLTSTSGAVYTRYWTYSDGQLAAVSTNNSTTYYLTYSDGYSMTSTATDGIYIYEKQTITVSSDGTSSGGDSGSTEDDTTTGGSTDATYGEGTYTTADDGSSQKVTFGTTTTEKKTVYVLTSSITSGTAYLIANSNSAGSAYVVANNSGSVAATGVTVVVDDTIGTYIELTDATDELWTASGSSSTTLKNGSYYLYPRTKDNGSLELRTESRNWSYSNNRLSYSNYYLYYSNGWDVSSTQNSVYFYVPTEVDVTVGSEVTYSVTTDDIIHIFDADASNTTTTITKSVTDGTPDGTYTYTVESGADIISVDENGNVTFTGTEGTATVKVAYTFTQNDVEYTIWDTITVTASYPFYTVDITHNSDGTGAVGTTADYVSASDTIAIKGVEQGDTYDLWAKVYLNGEGEAVTVDSSALTWSTNNASVISQTEDGNIVFTGNEGTAQVTVYYSYTNSKGETVKAIDTVTFSVTKTSYFVPSDGTNDFPEYPNQGSIRIDKTGVALGNFSQTGIAQMELSMTGVPYGTSAKTDVVIMVDMTASMSDDDVTAAQLAVKELIETLVYDEENDKYDSNIQLFVSSFSSGSSDTAVTITDWLSETTISSDAELTAAQDTISFSQSSQGGGTRYNIAMADVYETLNRDGHADNQFVVFVSDGVATAYAPLTDGALGTTITGSNSETASLCAGWFDDTGAVTSSFETEYYSYMIKTAGIPIYTVGANLTALSDAADLLNHMSSNYSADGKTATGETKYSFFCTTSGGITDEVLTIFQGIGQDIKEAAVNVVVEDKIADKYTMNFSLPSGVTATEAGMEEFYIQAVSYELDENNERLADPTVIEKFVFHTDGTITHTIGTAACGDSCTHVTYDDDGVVATITGTYFTYTRTVDDEGKDTEIITWKAEKLDRKELALQYFLYLDNSAGDVAAADQVAPGTYDTNAYAHITYTNHLGNECRQYFPVPSLTWKGAKVTYVFYLVNEEGQPVNRAGKVIPFAEAIYVTDPVTYDVTWNEIEGQENLLAESLMASAGVPEVYSLYDTSASYVIRVYETEGVDTTAKNGNYFEISGSNDKLIDSALDSDTTVDNSTTKVFNTKSGVKYDQYGVYSAHAVGTTLTTGQDADGNATYTTTTIQATDIDYANTTVAFAVVWTPALTPDVVVIDYGLDVVINVYENDGLAAGVTGVSLTAPSGVEINKGTYGDSQKVGSDAVTDTDGIWTAAKESLTSVRFSLDRDNGMQFSEPAVFYYEAGVNYYTYDSAGTATLNTTNMYSSVTVIPATTVYYEDDFVDYTVNDFSSGDVIWQASNAADYADAARTWEVEGTAIVADQDTDRPGTDKVGFENYDADNNYGYDSAYDNMSTWSMGAARKIKVDPSYYGEALFSFYGTGFDVISMTDNTTGAIFVTVKDASGATVKNLMVDTYYGYAYDEENDEWVTTDSADPNAIYQVPVICVEGLDYGKYDVSIRASYNTFFDNTEADDFYYFYLDAIRIYDPVDTSTNSDVADVYVQDQEGWPIYTELRDNVIDAATLADGEVQINGIAFMDGVGISASVTDYTNYGPNNELYLMPGQAIAFNLNLADSETVASVQLGIKSAADGKTAAYKIFDASTVTEKSDLDTITASMLQTATDMYYDITALKDKTIVVYNPGTSSETAEDGTITLTGGILSLTNIKVTHTAQPTAAAALFYVDTAVINNIIDGMNTETFNPTFTVEVPTSVYAGESIAVTVTTGTDVAAVSVNGELLTSYTVSDTSRIWTSSISTTEAGTVTVEVVAYDAEGRASESTVTKTVTVQASPIREFIEKLFGWLFG